MRRLWYVILLLIVSLLAFGNAGAQNLIAPYETGDKYFERFEIGDLIVYFHQRTLGGAIVEKDFINYQFDKETKELQNKKENWRKDLPEVLPPAMLPVISAAQAAARVPGEVLFAELYIISPESVVFPIKPPPTNPCWVVRSVVDGQQVVSIIDAVTGQDLGRGIPPPYESFSLTGPTDLTGSCSGSWAAWASSAENWYNAMGYPCEKITWPTRATIQTHAIQNSYDVLFYELAHGGYWYFSNACGQSVVPADIKAWIGSLRKFSFAFIGSCAGMCDTGPNTMSYEFRKGSNDSTATVGYCHMDAEYCSSCWGYSVDWQNTLFYYMYYGYTIKQAFDLANAAYPTCAGSNNCMRFAGDTFFGLRKRAEIMGAGGSWSAGIWYYNLAQQLWYKPYALTPDRPGIPIAVCDINGDGKADMVSSWSSGLWWQNGATWGWNKVYNSSPLKLACADITGDGKAEIIGAGGWNGIWYWNPATNGWTQMHTNNPDGGLAAGDINGDGHADVASSWTSGLWWQNGANLAWNKVHNLPPQKVAVGDVTGDGKAEIIGTWATGIWYWNPATNGWTQMYTGVPSGPIAAGDVTGDGRADVVSIWPNGVWYQDGRTLGWTHFYSSAPASLAVGNISGN